MTNCKVHRIRQDNDESFLLDWISRNVLRIRQVKKIEFDYYFGGKTNLVFELTNSGQKSNAIFPKIAFDSKFRGLPHYHIIYIKSHSRQLDVEP